MQSDDDQDKLYTIQEVAKQLRVSDSTIRTWVEQGVMKAILLPSVGPRKKYRIRSSSLEKILHPPQQETE